MNKKEMQRGSITELPMVLGWPIPRRPAGFNSRQLHRSAHCKELQKEMEWYIWKDIQIEAIQALF